jgi:hypothetical protein
MEMNVIILKICSPIKQAIKGALTQNAATRAHNQVSAFHIRRKRRQYFFVKNAKFFGENILRS